MLTGREVHKFGGTSVSDLETLISIVAALEQPLIVVSAFSTVTDGLLKCIDGALAGDYTQELERLCVLHREMLEKTPSAHSARESTEENLSDLRKLLEGIRLLGECSARSRDNVISFGERMSSAIVAAALRAHWIDSRELIRTDEQFGAAQVDWKTSGELCKRSDLQIKGPAVVLVGGFVARSASGATTTLGRSGSDFTATILASLTLAKKVVIWTDVAGVFSADPRAVPEAFTLPEISYREASEMAFFGSKVLFSRMVYPCETKGIPIEVRKTSLADDSLFTLISAKSSLTLAISCVKDVAVIVVSGAGMKGRMGTASSVFASLRDANASAIMIAQASSEQEMCCVIEASTAEAVVEKLNLYFRNEIQLGIINEVSCRKSFSVINIVLGKSMQERPGVAAAMFSACAAACVNVVAVAQPGSEMSVSLVVKNSDSQKAMQAIHSALAPSRNSLRLLRSVSVVLLGYTGLVGSEVDRILIRMRPFWAESIATDVQVVCRANSKTLKFANGDEIDSSLETLLMELKQRNFSNVCIIDVTASMQVSEKYPTFLKAGYSVVAANKKASSGPLELFDGLDSYRLTGEYRYEASVMAGLPVLSTLPCKKPCESIR